MVEDCLETGYELSYHFCPPTWKTNPFRAAVSRITLGVTFSHHNSPCTCHNSFRLRDKPLENDVPYLPLGVARGAGVHAPFLRAFANVLPGGPSLSRHRPVLPIPCPRQLSAPSRESHFRQHTGRDPPHQRGRRPHGGPV